MAYTSFIWDLEDDARGNVQHCGQHGVSKEEAEEVLLNPIDFGESASSGYPVVFGDTSTGRHLMVVYQEIDADTVYPINAFEVPRRQKS